MYGKIEGGTGKDALKFVISILAVIVFVLALFFGLPYFFGGGGTTDYAIYIIGKTYEWLNAPEGAASQILLAPTDIHNQYAVILEDMAANLPAGMKTIPLDGVKICISGDIAWLSCTSNTSGDCKASQDLYSHEPDFGVLVTAQKPGYLSANVTIPDLSVQTPVVVAILVKDTSQ